MPEHSEGLLQPRLRLQLRARLPGAARKAESREDEVVHSAPARAVHARRDLLVRARRAAAALDAGPLQDGALLQLQRRQVLQREPVPVRARPAGAAPGAAEPLLAQEEVGERPQADAEHTAAARQGRVRVPAARAAPPRTALVLRAGALSPADADAHADAAAPGADFVEPYAGAAGPDGLLQQAAREPARAAAAGAERRLHAGDQAPKAAALPRGARARQAAAARRAPPAVRDRYGEHERQQAVPAAERQHQREAVADRRPRQQRPDPLRGRARGEPEAPDAPAEHRHPAHEQVRRRGLSDREEKAELRAGREPDADADQEIHHPVALRLLTRARGTGERGVARK